MDAVQGTARWGISGFLGKMLAQSKRLRRRAFRYVPDELIPRNPRRLRALEVGCGAGRLMVQLERAGWEVEGVEWDPIAADIARKVSGRTVWDGDFRQVNLPLVAYDLIVLVHVFEHLDDPLAGLRRIRELLAPGGHAVLYYPNPESFGARVFRDAWLPWDAPRHLVLPPGRPLSNMAKQLGLIPVHFRTSTTDAAKLFAHSRAYRRGRPVNLDRPDVRALDCLAATLEYILISLGLDWGEEVLLVLQKAPGCTQQRLSDEIAGVMNVS